MDFSGVTLASSLDLIIYCSRKEISQEEAIRTNSISSYETDLRETIHFCKQNGWLKDSENLEITSKSRLVLLSDAEHLMFRKMLNDILETHSIAWRPLLSRGRKEVNLYGERNIIQILRWCGLFLDGDDVEDWWLDQRSYSDEDEDRENALTGRKGERKTLAFEELRTGRKPEWTALELGDSEGFDVRSWVDDSEESNSLRIEVKASKRDVNEATFFLTRNEWDTAISGGDHIFHLWPDVDNGVTDPTIVTVEQMRSQVPDDLGDGKWLNMEIPMATFL